MGSLCDRYLGGILALHPRAGLALGALATPLLGGEPGQDHKRIHGEHHHQDHQAPGEAPDQGHDGRDRGQKPQRHDHRDVLLELLSESVPALPLAKPGGDPAIPARTRVRTPKPAEGTDEDHNPQGTDQTVKHVADRRRPPPGCPVDRPKQNRRSKQGHQDVGEVV